MQSKSDWSVRAVVFDVGKVLVPKGFSAVRIAPLLPDFSPGEEQLERLSQVLNTYRDDYDRGASVRWYWTHVLSDIGCAVDPQLIERLNEADQFCWSRIDPDMVHFIEKLNARGCLTAICSNAPFPLAESMSAHPWVKDHMCYTAFSSEVGLAKPDLAMYEHVHHVLETYLPQLQVEEVAFFDDRKVNVQAAEQYGWKAYLWTENDHIFSHELYLSLC